MRYARILKRLSPTQKEKAEIRKISFQVVSGLADRLPRGTRVLLAGSAAKGTFLAGAGDIDVFAIFPDSYSKEEMFAALESSTKEAFPRAKFEVGYAEHPYLRMQYKKRRVDIVPSYRMREGGKVKSAVDRSQLHTKYVLSHLGAAQKKEVLLLKQFLRANLLYGAEIKTRGFSGYLCELMIVHYGSFGRFAEAASSWKLPVRIYPGRRRRRPSPLRSSASGVPGSDSRFSGSPIIVIDPVDRNRNVAAVVTEENLGRLIFLCASFCEKPSEGYFFPKKPTKAQLKANARNRFIYALSFKKPKIVDDVLWGQLWRLSSQLESFLKKREFRVLGTHAYADASRCIIVFEVRSPTLPKNQTFSGPFLNMQKDVSAFMKKHPAPFYFEGGKIHAIAKRRLPNISSAIKEFKRRKDAPSHLQGQLPKSKFLKTESLLAKHPQALEEYFRISGFLKK